MLTFRAGTLINEILGLYHYFSNTEPLVNNSRIFFVEWNENEEKTLLARKYILCISLNFYPQRVKCQCTKPPFPSTTFVEKYNGEMQPHRLKRFLQDD